MITIRVFIPIYTYNKDIHKYNLTEKIFKHYKKVEEKFKERAIFKYVILGSEMDISRDLTLKYFKEEEYFEFKQNPSEGIYSVLTEKINYGFRILIEKISDIYLVAGSNDYICYDFFEQVLNDYNPLKPQLYGIDNFKNGKNAVFFCHYDGELDINNKEKCIEDDITNNKVSYWWDGISAYCNREKYNYCGGIIGINNIGVRTYPEITTKMNRDEGAMEYMILNYPDIHKFNSKELFYMNIKVCSNNDVTHYDKLLEYNKHNLLWFDELPDKLKRNFLIEFNMFINL